MFTNASEAPAASIITLMMEAALKNNMIHVKMNMYSITIVNYSDKLPSPK
jgi:hypothetical protein